MDFTGGKIIVRIVAPTSYNVPNDVDIIEVDTSSGGLTTINLQKITIGDARKSVYISDVSNNASNGKITIATTGGNLINNQSSIDLEVDGIIAEVNIADTKRFIANLSTDDSTPPTPPVSDKNFVFQQTSNLAMWTVSHNLNKRCAVQVLDTLYNEIEAKVHWVNNNEVEVYLNKAQMGWVYCN